MRQATASAIVSIAILSGCSGSAPVATPAPAPALQPQQAAANVAFVHGMIAHHAQAIEMAKLVPARTNSDLVKLLAERIDRSQADEIKQLRRWLDENGYPDASDAHTGHPMPGMLRNAELTALAEAGGAAFDRLFLELMIRHHDGALVMVEQLLATENGRPDPVLFAFAADVDAGQRAEIARMRKLLTAIQ